MAEKTVAEQIAEAVKAATEGLTSKNKELLKEVKETRESLTAFDGVDLKELQKSATELTKMKNKKQEDEGNYKKLYETQQEQAKTDKIASDKALADAKNLLATEVKTNALTKALVENHIDPVLVDSAALILKGDVALTDDGKAMVGDKTVLDHVKDWAAGDVGKRFVTDANFGGNANGPGGGGDDRSSFYDPNSPKFNRTEQAKIANVDPAVHEAFVKAAPAKKDN